MVLMPTPSSTAARAATPSRRNYDDGALMATVSSPALAASIVPSSPPPLGASELSANPLGTGASPPATDTTAPHPAPPGSSSTIAGHHTGKRRYSKSGPLNWSHDSPALAAAGVVDSTSILEAGQSPLLADENPFSILANAPLSTLPTATADEEADGKSTSSGDKLSNPYDEDELIERK